MTGTESSGPDLQSFENTWRRVTGTACKASAIGIVVLSLLYVCAVGKDAQRLLGFTAGGATGLLLIGLLPTELGRFRKLLAEKKRYRFLAFLMLVKYPLLGLLLYPLFGLKWADPLSFLGGFVLVQAALVASALLHLTRPVHS